MSSSIVILSHSCSTTPDERSGREPQRPETYPVIPTKMHATARGRVSWHGTKHFSFPRSLLTMIIYSIIFFFIVIIGPDSVDDMYLEAAYHN